MRLRLAKKICKAMVTDGGDRYTGWQQLQAVNRTCRTKSAKEADRCWDATMIALGPEGRRELTQRFIVRDEQREAELLVKHMIYELTDADRSELEQVRRQLAYFRDGKTGD